MTYTLSTLYVVYVSYLHVYAYSFVLCVCSWLYSSNSVRWFLALRTWRSSVRLSVASRSQRVSLIVIPFCLSVCLSVIPRPTAYHDWSIITKFGRQVYRPTCPRTRVNLSGSPVSHTSGARGKICKISPISNAYSCHCERDASCHVTCLSVCLSVYNIGGFWSHPEQQKLEIGTWQDRSYPGYPTGMEVPCDHEFYCVRPVACGNMWSWALRRQGLIT